MNWDLHKRAMALTDEKRYAEAAELEEQATLAVGDGLPRTLGILAQSAVSMWMKAGNEERAREFFRSVRERMQPHWAGAIENLIKTWRKTDG